MLPWEPGKVGGKGGVRVVIADTSAFMGGCRCFHEESGFLPEV